MPPAGDPACWSAHHPLIIALHVQFCDRPWQCTCLQMPCIQASRPRLCMQGRDPKWIFAHWCQFWNWAISLDRNPRNFGIRGCPFGGTLEILRLGYASLDTFKKFWDPSLHTVQFPFLLVPVTDAPKLLGSASVCQHGLQHFWKTIYFLENHMF